MFPLITRAKFSTGSHVFYPGGCIQDVLIHPKVHIGQYCRFFFIFFPPEIPSCGALLFFLI